MLGCGTIKITFTLLLMSLSVLSFYGCDHNKATEQVDIKRVSDAINQVVMANRSVYTRHVAGRLALDNNFIKISENWEEQKALPVPSQLLHLGAGDVMNTSRGDIHYSLKSLWAINKSHFPDETHEREGLIYLLKNPGKNYYKWVQVDSEKYFLGIYPDVAVEQACVGCHNGHSESPKRDFKKGDLMGALVVRVKY